MGFGEVFWLLTFVSDVGGGTNPEGYGAGSYDAR